jgi:hypothetical protein
MGLSADSRRTGGWSHSTEVTDGATTEFVEAMLGSGEENAEAGATSHMAAIENENDNSSF